MTEGRPMATSRFACWQTKLSAISWAALVSPTWQLLAGAQNDSSWISPDVQWQSTCGQCHGGTPALLSTWPT